MSPPNERTLDFAERQLRNRRISSFLILGFVAFFVVIGFAVDHLYLGAFVPGGRWFPFATVAALLVAVAATASGYRFGAELILKAVGAEPLDPEIPEHRELRNVVKEMALASGCPMPRVFVVYDSAPNAFATGRDENNSAVCITTGLLALLGREETQGVVAHEIAHIRNRDTRVMMLVSVLLGGVALLADWAQRSLYASRHGRRGGHWLMALPALVLIALAPFVGRLMALAVSRQREYLADAAAVEFTRNPLGLAKALERIRDAAIPFHKATRGTAHLFFVNPLPRGLDDRDGSLADLLSSHPPIDRRIRLLYRMAGLAAPAPV
ncbi:MAG TPA: M48 family metallopeptidase [Candidatus Eisenbacteria bacterium]|nr:M48 family metallopeptidase [Candidatus Eisenbacteria bacterium]